MRLLADVAALKSNPAAQRQMLFAGLSSMVSSNEAFPYVFDGCSEDGSPTFNVRTSTADQDPLRFQSGSPFSGRHPIDSSSLFPKPMRHPPLEGSDSFDDVPTTRYAETNFAAFVEMRHAGRMADAIVSLLGTSKGGRQAVGVGVHRCGNSRGMSDRDRNLMAFAVTEIKDLIDRGHIALSSTTSSGLSPRLECVLGKLLARNVPKTTARELSISVETVREYIHRLYLYFQVSGRDDLTAKFLRLTHSPLNSQRTELL